MKCIFRRLPRRAEKNEQFWNEPQPPVEYHKLGLEVNAICLVDSAATFHEFLDQGMKVIFSLQFSSLALLFLFFGPMRFVAKNL